MKKTILSIVAIGLFAWCTLAAYAPTKNDTTNIKNLKTQLDTAINNDNTKLRNLYQQASNLQTQYSWDERLNYMLWELKYYLYNNLSAQKNAAKVTTKLSKKSFLDMNNTWYYSGITDTVDQCIWRYNTIDDLSFAYDFPTAVTLAVRYRESSCWYYLPSNWDWPFQITTKDYGTGTLTQTWFIQAVEDFLVFAKNKWKKSPSWNLSYWNYDMTWIVNFAALYNWGKTSWNDVIPNAPKYVYEGYWENYATGNKFGIVPQTLKILEWELNNKY